MENTNYKTALNWRYATKMYDPSKKLTDEQFSGVVEAIRLAATSFGLYPFKVVNVVDMEKRKLLQEKAFGQSQFVDASHILVFVVPNKLDQAWVDMYFEKVKSVRGMTEEQVAAYKQMVSGFVASKSAEDLKVWSAKQAYIGLGFGLNAAAVMGIDSTPMEGFDANGVDEVLGLKEMGMSSVVCLALGFRSENDQSAHYKKVRFDVSEMMMVE